MDHSELRALIPGQKQCGKVIPLRTDKDGRLMSSTYCMRPIGHEDWDPKGGCDLRPTAADVARGTL